MNFRLEFECGRNVILFDFVQTKPFGAVIKQKRCGEHIVGHYKTLKYILILLMH